MKKKRTPVRQRDVWTPDGRHMKQLTLFRLQKEDPDQPLVTNGRPKKRRARKKFLLKGDEGPVPSETGNKG